MSAASCSVGVPSGGRSLLEFKPETGRLPAKWCWAKTLGETTRSAFLSTSLTGHVRDLPLVAAGVITNNSVVTTVRSAGDLGFAVTLAHDEFFPFARRDWFGMERTAHHVHAMGMSNLDGEYCRVLSTSDILCDAETYSPSFPSPP